MIHAAEEDVDAVFPALPSCANMDLRRRDGSNSLLLQVTDISLFSNPDLHCHPLTSDLQRQIPVRSAPRALIAVSVRDSDRDSCSGLFSVGSRLRHVYG
jgi:hypothetical protein